MVKESPMSDEVWWSVAVVTVCPFVRECKGLSQNREPFKINAMVPLVNRSTFLRELPHPGLHGRGEHTILLTVTAA